MADIALDHRKRQAVYAAKHREKSKAQGRPDARAVQAAVFNALSHRLMIAWHNKRSDEVFTLQGILMDAAVELYKTYDKAQVLDKISSMRSDHRE